MKGAAEPVVVLTYNLNSIEQLPYAMPESWFASNHAFAWMNGFTTVAQDQ